VRENGEIVIKPEEKGRYIDKEACTALLPQIKENGPEVKIPYSSTDAEITKKSLEGKLFNKELASYTSGMEDISIREQDGKYYLSKSKASVKIDLGGIAKGYLSDLVAEKLLANGTKSAIVNVTGNLYLLGKKINSDGSLLDWRIGVNNCFEAGGEYLCGIICPQNTAVVTSGTYERYYKKNEIKINHIINPFTGMPVGVAYNGEYSNTSNHVVSATVIGSNGAVCDALATAVCVLGMESGASLIQSEGLSALIVTADGKYTTVGTVDFMAGDFLINGMEKV
jgi:thiamine biosynthesis lipoprotein